MSNLVEALQRGVHAHQNGNYNKAKNYYIEVLNIQPDNPQANYNLGLLETKFNNLSTATNLFKTATNKNPKIEQFWLSYIFNLIDQKRFDEAKKMLSKAKENLLNNNNILKMEEELELIIQNNQTENLFYLFKNKKNEEALHEAKNITYKFPKNLLAWKILASLYQSYEDYDQSIKCMQIAIKLAPNDPEIYNNYGVTLEAKGNLKEAKEKFQKAITIKNNYSEPYFNLANILNKFEKFEKAEVAYKQAIKFNPNFSKAINNYANFLLKQNRFEEAVNNFKSAIALTNNQSEYYYNYGNCLVELNKLNEAEEVFQQAIKLNPKNAMFFNNLANTQSSLSKLREAELNYKKAITLDHSYAEAYSNLGDTYKLSKKYEDALKNYETAFSINPKIDYLFGKMVFVQTKLCDWKNFYKNKDKLEKKIINNSNIIHPFPLQSISENPIIQKKSSEIYSKSCFINLNFPSIPKYSSKNKIRICYFSSDFNNHPVGFLTSSILKYHEKQKFEIYCFALTSDRGDTTNTNIKNNADFYHNVSEMSDKEIINLARHLEIDIAIDLNGFTKNHRSNVFFNRAAPIQVNYLGFLGTMGSKSYDYIISDKIVIPEQHKNYYHEKVVSLPFYGASYQNKYLKDIKNKEFLRKDFSIPSDCFTFCCFNSTYKITPNIFDTWMKILKKVKNSVLIICEENEFIINNLQKQAFKHNIKKEKLIFVNYLSKSDYLARYKVVDLFLDTYPYNGASTVSDAVSVGLPVLTYLGESFASRQAATHLNSVHLNEMITHTLNEYENLAIELAAKPAKLNEIKNKLLRNLPKSTFYNTKIYTKTLENSYLQMYERYQNSLNPNHIDID